MRRIITSFLTAFCIAGSACAQQALDDNELAAVSGADGVSIAMHLSLNDPALGPAGENRISMGFNVDGKTTHLVMKNLHGSIDMFALTLDVETKPDGGSYLAIGLPVHMKYNDWGFDSLSVQADPAAAVTESLGRMSINGTVSMQGQLRLWAH
ncbi:MAG TPA: hypothetical protein VEC01_01435 [Noviherbaspirillum sp.]|uniref:hypothetical protein n=1 Tax=Noviherbaspirillum sp. TaxID=1926288 RepID=UPI002D32465A|nr:hypothetical protein [Noviherbaspirillum sp.]HYD93958.1 hypothetical protein [Noviherbaspirillum sp.]